LPGKSGAGFYGRLVRNLLSPLPYSVQVHRTAALRTAIRQVAARRHVDLWHCEWTPYAESLRGIVDGPWVVMAHNVESLIWRRYCEIETNPWKRWYIRGQWRKFERFERRVFAETAQLIAVSEQDAALARDHFQAPRVKVVENGVDVAWFCPQVARCSSAGHVNVGHVSNVPNTMESSSPSTMKSYSGDCASGPRDPRSLLFLGSLDWRPNLDAARLLLDGVFPKVLAAEPQARLAIVGRKPPQWLVDRARRCENVALHADVPDVRPFLHQCGAMAVPLRVGGGSRLKILEALAAECPVVSTKVGAEGLRLTPGRHFVEADSVDDMADALVGTIRNPQPIQEMARRGRDAVADRYDWSIMARKLEEIWLEQRKSN
jgi:glycosyltransferase involved in cell wall biosynthesis